MCDLVKTLLNSMSSDGWSQMSRIDLVHWGLDNKSPDPELFADFCLCLGIGDGVQSGTVQVEIRYRESSEWNR